MPEPASNLLRRVGQGQERVFVSAASGRPRLGNGIQRKDIIIPCGPGSEVSV